MAIYLYPAAEDHDYSCRIFQDFSKAFDTVTNKILLTKLEYYTIRGFVKDWFSSYPSNRTQTVSLGSVISEMQTVFCGVSRISTGATPFPHLYSWLSQLPKTIGFSPFADEAIHFLSIRTLTYKSEINSELGKVHIWLFENKLSVNIEKSNFVIFHLVPKQIPKKVMLFINDQSLTDETSMRYLGVYIDSNIS